MGQLFRGAVWMGAVLLVSGYSVSAWAEAELEEQVKQLRRSDENVNYLFKRIQNMFVAEQAEKWQKRQDAWVKERNEKCQWTEGSSANWESLTDGKQVQCLQGRTTVRMNALAGICHTLEESSLSCLAAVSQTCNPEADQETIKECLRKETENRFTKMSNQTIVFMNMIAAQQASEGASKGTVQPAAMTTPTGGSKQGGSPLVQRGPLSQSEPASAVSIRSSTSRLPPIQTTDSCRFDEQDLPKDFALLVAGGYRGFDVPYRIDESSHSTSQMDVMVNRTDKPVVLMLGAYDPTIWNVQWTRGTRIAAILATGYHLQAVAGVNEETKVMVSTHVGKSPCGNFYVSEKFDPKINEMAQKIFGRKVDQVFLISGGRGVAGNPLEGKPVLETSKTRTPQSMHDPNIPPMGKEGMDVAEAQGLIRPATQEDLDAWSRAMEINKSGKDGYVPVIGAKSRPLSTTDAYVVLKSFTVPNGAGVWTFLVPKGVPVPIVKATFVNILDFNTMQCTGISCRYMQ